MIHAADIREWRNRSVVDPKGHKIGVLEAVYVDTSTDEPAMATVRTGLPTRHQLSFVPLDEAILGPGYVKVSYAKRLVKKAPSVGSDAREAYASWPSSCFSFWSPSCWESSEWPRKVWATC
ncbi:PRC-barrel domain-containing protein [Streptomyces lincolnensis]|uniref:PRC-barrel domain-containing protein n=1 Tax=Streptomyces lincolnensis TaxID=1915 RepID=UPI001E51C10A|nr:PRC-barrel domain-containing protein [Streptomyces lincolnensis]